MSQQSSTTWKTATAILLVITVILAGASLYLFAANNGLQNDKNNQANQITSLNTQLSKDNQTIASLNSQITDLNGQIASLQAQHTADQATIASLQSTVADLQSKLDTLRAVNVTIIFTWKSTAPVNICIFGICAHIADGTATVTDVAWANLGTTDAHNVVATAKFHASTDGTGPVLCSVSGNLGPMGSGTVIGHSIDMQNDLTANNSCTTDNSLAQSATASVVWT